MAETLSVIGSALAIFSLVIQSCEVVCVSLRSFREVEADLDHHIATIDALRTTFAYMSQFEPVFPQKPFNILGCKSRSQKCLQILKEVESLIQAPQRDLQRSQIRKTWTKAKWVGVAQEHKIERLMAQIESYQRSFSLDLLLINVCLSPRCPQQGRSDQKRAFRRLNREAFFKEMRERRRQLSVECTNSSQTSLLGLERSSIGTSSFANRSQTHDPHLKSNLPESFVQNTQIPANHNKFTGVPELSYCYLHKSLTPTEVQNLVPVVTSVRNIASQISENMLLPYTWWLGQIRKKCYITTNRQLPQCTRLSHGYAVKIKLFLPRSSALNVNSYLLWRTDVESSLSFSLDYHFKIQTILSWDCRAAQAAMEGNIEVMKNEFERKKASPFHILPDGSTLLHLAAAQNQSDMVGFLLKQGAQVNATNDLGETVLHRSMELAKEPFLPRLLLQHGADLSAVTTDGRSPLHTFFTPAMKMMLLCFAASSLDVEFEARDGRGRTIFHYLAWSSKTTPDLFDILRNRTPAATAACLALDEEDRSVLHFAARRGNAALISHILSYSSHVPNVNGTDCRGRTPMHYASESKRAGEAIEALASSGGDITFRDLRGRTPLHAAGELDRVEAVERFLEIDPACKEIRDDFGLTAWHMAKRSGAQAVMARLASEPSFSEAQQKTRQLKEQTEDKRRENHPTSVYWGLVRQVQPKPPENLQTPFTAKSWRMRHLTQRFWEDVVPIASLRLLLVICLVLCSSFLAFAQGRESARREDRLLEAIRNSNPDLKRMARDQD